MTWSSFKISKLHSLCDCLPEPKGLINITNDLNLTSHHLHYGITNRTVSCDVVSHLISNLSLFTSPLYVVITCQVVENHTRSTQPSAVEHSARGVYIVPPVTQL